MLVENFRPGLMKRRGFNYEKVSEINPEIEHHKEVKSKRYTASWA